MSVPQRAPLRERKKAATMHRVQEAALDLFAVRGFDGVTIEEVADAAEVSPSTVYRYFGTKEGLVLHDEYDDRLFEAVGRFLADGLDLWGAAEAALATIMTEHFEEEAASTLARVRLWWSTPSIQSAAYLVIDDAVEVIAGHLAATGRYTRAQGRVLASSIVWPFIATLKNWHEDGGVKPWPAYLAEALQLLRPPGDAGGLGGDAGGTGGEAAGPDGDDTGGREANGENTNRTE